MVPFHSHLAGISGRRRALWNLVMILCVPAAAFTSAESLSTNSVLAAWLAAQTKIQTWSADFTQTRSLKSFAQPLTANGHVWFAAPNRFRWELGNPPQTIALRNATELTVIYPKLKRAEKYPLAGNTAGEWKDTLALLDAGFPRDRKELESRFNIDTVRMFSGRCELVLQPKSPSARKMMPRITVEFDTSTYGLTATELQFADGSTMRNDFRNAAVNEKVDPARFEPELDPTFKVVEPLSRH